MPSFLYSRNDRISHTRESYSQTLRKSLIVFLPMYPDSGCLPLNGPWLSAFPCTLVVSLPMYPVYLPPHTPWLSPFPCTLVVSFPMYPGCLPSHVPQLSPFPYTLVVPVPMNPGSSTYTSYCCLRDSLCFCNISCISVKVLCSCLSDRNDLSTVLYLKK